MAYKKEDIVQRSRAMLGESFRAGSEARLDGLCIAAAMQLESRLRVNVDRSDIEAVFVAAASLLAVSMYMELERECGELESFSAGELSVKLKSGSSAGGADSLRKQAETMLAPYTESGAFGFMGVEA